jgi:hypothetical protein
MMTKHYLRRLFELLRMLPPFVFVWMLAWFTYQPLRRRTARKRLPKAGKRLGLGFKRAALIQEFGEFHGSYDGRELTINPDSGAFEMILNFKGSGDLLDFSISKPYTHPEPGQTDIETPGLPFLLTSRVNRQVEKAWLANRRVHQKIADFYARHYLSLEFFSFNSYYFGCRFDYGKPFAAYLPAELIEPVVKSMTDIAEELEKLLKS